MAGNGSNQAAARRLAAAALTLAWGAFAEPAAAVDCWRLDDGRRATAMEQGLCADAFARAPDPEPRAADAAPPYEGPVVTPARKPPAPALRRHASARHGQSVTRASAARAGRADDGGDFFTSFRRDLGRLGDLFTGG